MRVILMIAAAVLVTAAALADDKAERADRERRVRVALALAGTDTPAVADCGKCREDVNEARADGLKEGKPVVLFVGGCPGSDLADAVCQGGGIPAKADVYTGDDRPPSEKRVIILEPKADRKGYMRVDVPRGATAKELRERVKASVPVKAEAKPPPTTAAPLNWQF